MESSRGSSAGTRTDRQTSVCLKTRKRPGRKFAVAASRRLDVSGHHRHAPDRSNAPESSNSASVRDDLPSQQLSQLLKHLSISERNSTLAPLSPASNGLQEALVANFNDVVLPHLQSLLPTTTIQKLLPDSARYSTECQLYSMAQIDFLTYAASNNLAGMDKTTGLKLVYEYLKDPLHELMANISPIVSRNMTLANILAAKPMVETLFRGAIEAGDDHTVHTLLSVRELGLDANNGRCFSSLGELCSPIEKAAELHHVSVVKALLAHGANVHGVGLPLEDSEWSRKYIHFSRGALESALRRFGHSKDIPVADSSSKLELVKLLLQAGGTFSGDSLSRVIRDNDSEIARTLIRGRLATCFKSWLELGIFHQAIEGLDFETNELIIRQLSEAKSNLNYKYCDHTKPLQQRLLKWQPGCPTYLIDIATGRGDFQVVQLLYDCGARLRENTLTAAIRSGNQRLIHTVLTWGARVDDFSSHFKSTPYAEAIRMRDFKAMEILVERGCEANLHEPFRLCAALAALAEVGDFAALKNMREKCFSRSLHEAWVDTYALARAVCSDHTDIAVYLLETGASPHSRDVKRAFGQWRDHEYCAWGGYGVEGNSDSRATSPLLAALDNRNATIVRKLLDHGALRHHEMLLGRNPYLEAAVSWGQLSIVKELAIMRMGLGWGCSVSVAVRNKDRICVEYLLDCGADSDCTGHSLHNDHTDYDSPLEEAVKNSDVPMISLLLTAGADPTRSGALRTALITDATMFDILLTAISEFSPKRRLDCFSSALHAVISFRATAQLRRLLETYASAGSSISELGHCITSCERATAPLAEAITTNGGTSLELVALLLEFDVDLRVPITSGRDGLYLENAQETALLLAIGTKKPKMVQLLLERGADVNAPAIRGIQRTPLQKAAEVGSYDIVQLLLSHNADVNACPAPRGGATALQLAAIGGYIGLVELLMTAGADLLAPGAQVNGRTAFGGAAEHGRCDTVKYLADRASHSDEQLESARLLAAENGHMAVVDMIQSLQAESRARSTVLKLPICLDSAYACDNCGEVMSNASALRRHERTRHGSALDQRKFTCEDCGRGFGRKDNLTRHLATHMQGGQRPCPRCGSMFRRQDYLSVHLRSCQQTTFMDIP